MKFGTILRQKIEQTYPDFLEKFPRYRKALDIMELLMNEKRKENVLFINDFDSDIIYAVEHEPQPQIEIIPKNEPTMLAWNSDYYFDNYYVWKPIINRKTLTALELLADASAWLKLFFSTRLHKYLYEKTNYYNLTYPEALKLKQTFPITQLLNRIRNYYQIPVIKFENNDPLQTDYEVIREKVLGDPQNPRVQKYANNIKTFEASSGIKLTTDEKIEYITQKLLEELIPEDYDEIES
jgi:hypothetical protein